MRLFYSASSHIDVDVRTAEIKLDCARTRNTCPSWRSLARTRSQQLLEQTGWDAKQHTGRAWLLQIVYSAHLRGAAL